MTHWIRFWIANQIPVRRVCIASGRWYAEVPRHVDALCSYCLHHTPSVRPYDQSHYVRHVTRNRSLTWTHVVVFTSVKCMRQCAPIIIVLAVHNVQNFAAKMSYHELWPIKKKSIIYRTNVKSVKTAQWVYHYHSLVVDRTKWKWRQQHK